MSPRHPLNILKEGRRQEKEIEYEDLGQRAGERDIHALRASAPDAVELNGGLERSVGGKEGKRGRTEGVGVGSGWGEDTLPEDAGPSLRAQQQAAPKGPELLGPV